MDKIKYTEYETGFLKTSIDCHLEWLIPTKESWSLKKREHEFNFKIRSLSVCLSVCLSVSPSVSQSVCLSVCLSVSLSPPRPFSLSFFLSLPPSLFCSSLCLLSPVCLHLFLSVSVCLSLSPLSLSLVLSARVCVSLFRCSLLHFFLEPG